MKIVGLIWYEKILEKLEQKHNVQQHEVREVFASNPKFRYVENGLQPEENIYAALGRTKAGRYMNKNKSSVSKAQSYNEIGEYWDTHDLAEHWEETKPAEFEIDIKSEITYYAVDKELSAKIQAFARRRGVSPDTLLNIWLQEKLQEQNN